VGEGSHACHSGRAAAFAHPSGSPTNGRCDGWAVWRRRPARPSPHDFDLQDEAAWYQSRFAAGQFFAMLGFAAGRRHGLMAGRAVTSRQYRRPFNMIRIGLFALFLFSVIAYAQPNAFELQTDCRDIILDLKSVGMVDRDVMRFFVHWEAVGVKLEVSASARRLITRALLPLAPGEYPPDHRNSSAQTGCRCLSSHDTRQSTLPHCAHYEGRGR
jgi:hypothetical protein